MAENPKTKWKTATVHVRNSEILLAMSNVSGVCEGFKHLWSGRSDWNVQGNKFSDKCNNLIFFFSFRNIIISLSHSKHFSACGRKKELQKNSKLSVKGVKLLFSIEKVKHLKLVRAKSLE